LPSEGAYEESHSVKGERQREPKNIDIFEGIGNVFDPNFSDEEESEDR